MKALCVWMIFGMLVLGCNNSQVKQTDDSSKASKEVSIEIQEEELAQKAVIGIYYTTLPCADCEGIESTITLGEGGKAEIKNKYLGKSDEYFSEKGMWQVRYQIVTFIGEKENSSYKANGRTLKLLDLEGNEIAGSLADKYIYHKVEH